MKELPNFCLRVGSIVKINKEFIMYDSVTFTPTNIKEGSTGKITQMFYNTKTKLFHFDVELPEYLNSDGNPMLLLINNNINSNILDMLEPV